MLERGTAKLPCCGSGTNLTKRLEEFRDNESGVLVGFGVFLILILLAVGGMGIDFMRFEYTRTSLQSTLDRAVLAAADLDQTLDAQFVVEDYFAKSDLGNYLKTITVDEGLAHKQVSATAEIAMDTQLIHMVGVPVLNAKAAGSAKESLGAVEISLILDVSGSMGWYSRLTNLKVAAKDFVDLVLDNTKPGDVSISVVPYATQVSLGETMMNEYNVSNEHNYSHCVDFLADEFNNAQILPTEALQRTAHFDPWNQDPLPSGQTLIDPVCPTNQNTRILPFSNDSIALKDHIEGLTAGGNTSIDLGMKWGVALLDPTTGPVVDGLIASGVVENTFADRPKPYDPDQNLKIAIIMTDGENTEQPYMLSPYLDEMSDIWRHNSGKFSVKHNSEWYYPHDGTWNSAPYKDTNGQGSQQISYPELHAMHPLLYLAEHLWGGILGTLNAAANKAYGKYEVHNAGWKDQRLDKICEVAKTQGIIVFTIAFEAPNQGKRLLKRCASSDGHYFDTDGLEINDAFVSIASSISKLRLVQ
ncbi:TadE/TadG family type IV pilus assembly protein [Alisedimentitalea sp. MJ-SS2]|uniref:TadE/TadG family type IV pilus assembly protein n=1 Tax=Aliisedimentitalea sp. MJ-SS2 TaxID=3049795 RepID=UPI0029104023|nr:TadE/TadG family type IV pilus assembly protein [Alisedimentitalea sp. MJ-SS2]MDU8929987.1 TadE/TadG family type IV pilus assembly protein [Alisedimentitalea sp. MJ-SS2]